MLLGQTDPTFYCCLLPPVFRFLRTSLRRVLIEKVFFQYTEKFNLNLINVGRNSNWEKSILSVPGEIFRSFEDIKLCNDSKKRSLSLQHRNDS